jgi:hypothetical protein
MNNINRLVCILITSLFVSQSSFADNHKEIFGSKKEALELLNRAVNLVKLDETLAFSLIASKQGGFFNKDLYPFCIALNGIMVAHPYSTGTDMSSFKTSDGIKVTEIMMENAKNGKISKLTYKLGRPSESSLTEKQFKKTTFYTKVKNYVCASGFYSK